MRISNPRLLRRYVRRHREAQEAIEHWTDVVRAADWRTPHDVGRAPVRSERLGGKRFVFRLLNNRYRIVAEVDYARQSVTIRFIGAHARYDRINAKEV